MDKLDFEGKVILFQEHCIAGEQFLYAIDVLQKRGSLSGRGNVKKRLLEEAMNQYKKALVLGENSSLANYRVGFIYSELWQYSKALTYMRKAVNLNSHRESSHFGLAETLFQLGQEKEALGHYREALKLNPQKASNYEGLGKCCFFLGEFEEAINHLRTATKLDDSLVVSYYYLGIAYRKADPPRLKLSCRALRRAVKLCPPDPEYHFELARTYYKLKKPAKVEESLLQAMRFNPDIRKIEGAETLERTSQRKRTRVSPFQSKEEIERIKKARPFGRKIDITELEKEIQKEIEKG